ncbi:uncharacterized protein LOC135492415 [Lineus longissimus]|uniref:uncharacterized protein LOC135492415 n=1 Tax=Lineus longissimus TaxID=88925 RepID=UPI002B4E4A8A
MSGDIREQAASRHKHRRHPTHTKDDDLLGSVELDLSPRTELSPRTKRSPRDRSFSLDINVDELSPRSRPGGQRKTSSTDEEISPRPRTGGRQRQASTEAKDILIEKIVPAEAPSAGVTATFIKCKCQGKELRAMINTALPINLISKSAAAACGLQSRADARVKSVEVTFGEDRKVKLDLKVESDCSDLVLGVEFLKMNMSQLDFANSVLLIHGNTKIPFLTGRDIPPKYRSNTTPASSL